MNRQHLHRRIAMGTLILGLSALVPGTGTQADDLIGHGGRGGYQNPLAFPAGALPYGASLAEWQALDWQSYMAKPYDPEACVLGPVGRFGSTHDVLHLNVSLGTPVEYTCTIPTGMALLVPVVTTMYLCPLTCGPGTIAPNGTVEELDAAANADIDLVSRLEVEIDGRLLPGLFGYRTTSPAFSGEAVPGNVLDPLVVGPYGPAVAAGYYVMLPPLPAGDHVIRVLGVLGDPPIYEFLSLFNLTVGPGPAGLTVATLPVAESTWGAVKSLFK